MEDRVKVWLYDNNMREQELIEIYEYMISINHLLKQLKDSGITYKNLPSHLLTDLKKKYNEQISK